MIFSKKRSNIFSVLVTCLTLFMSNLCAMMIKVPKMPASPLQIFMLLQAYDSYGLPSDVVNIITFDAYFTTKVPKLLQDFEEGCKKDVLSSIHALHKAVISYECNIPVIVLCKYLTSKKISILELMHQETEPVFHCRDAKKNVLHRVCEKLRWDEAHDCCGCAKVVLLAAGGVVIEQDESSLVVKKSADSESLQAPNDVWDLISALDSNGNTPFNYAVGFANNSIVSLIEQVVISLGKGALLKLLADCPEYGQSSSDECDYSYDMNL